jgi:hypothetical protein
MLGLLQRSYLEQVVSRRKDKVGLTCIWALHGRRSIEYFCCGNRNLCYSIDVCDTVIPGTLGLGRSLGEDSSRYQS